QRSASTGACATPATTSSDSAAPPQQSTRSAPSPAPSQHTVGNRRYAAPPYSARVRSRKAVAGRMPCSPTRPVTCSARETKAMRDSLSQASADKERLMQEVAENTRLVSEISKELATVAVPAKRLKVGAAESPLRASRDTMVAKIRYITTRVRDLEPKLQQSE